MELTIEQALQQGVAAHKKGQVEEAERLSSTTTAWCWHTTNHDIREKEARNRRSGPTRQFSAPF